MMRSHGTVKPGQRLRKCRGDRGGGFALVIVLWVLAGLTVVAVAVATSARVSSESTKLLRDRVRAEAAFLGTGARIQIIVATSEPNANRYEGARGRLFLDGRVTQVAADERVTLQDGRGLVNLNRASAQQLVRFLAQCGVNAEVATSLSDTLADYVDADDLKRLNGAEAFDYRLSGKLPPPRNAPLLSREEIWRVQGWPDIQATWNQHACNNDVTVHGQDGSYNQSTATLPVMLANGLDERIAKGYMDARAAGLLTGRPELEGGGDPNDFFQLVRFSGSVGQTMRIRHSMGLVEWMLEYELELTPSRSGGPWRLHEVRYVNQTPTSTSPALPSSFPAVDYSPSEQERTQANAPPRLPFGN